MLDESNLPKTSTERVEAVYEAIEELRAKILRLESVNDELIYELNEIRTKLNEAEETKYHEEYRKTQEAEYRAEVAAHCRH